MKWFLLPAFIFLVPALTLGQSKETSGDGNHLLPICETAIAASDNNSPWKDTHEARSHGFCFGIVEGIVSFSPSVCTPKGVTNLQAARVVVKYLQEHPEKLNLQEALLANIALNKAFPCK